MSLDSASSQVRAPFHRPTSTVQTIGTRWAVAAGHSLAAEAAASVLSAGGNAVDAGVAGGFTLGVVHPDMVSVAGVAPILVHLARTGETWQVSGVGPYPKASSREYFMQRHGGQIPAGLPRTVVPAAPDAWCTALERWGTMSFADAISPALGHAERGFAVSAFSAYQMGANADKYKRWPSSVALYLRDGRAYRMGEVLVQSELADTLKRMVAAEKRAGGSRSRRHPGGARRVLSRRDGQAHRRVPPRQRGPARAERPRRFLGRGGAGAADVVRRLRSRGVRLLVPGPGAAADAEHPRRHRPGRARPQLAGVPAHIVESIKLAFADRDAYYGDPNFVKIPAERLLSKAYGELRRAQIREKAWQEMPPPGDAELRRTVLPLAGGSTDALDTSYVAVIDAEGNGFSATPSDPNVDSPAVSGVGCVVSPRGSQGWLDPNHASVVAPGKRPRLTPAPAMALSGGKLMMPFGTPGGDVQQQAMLQVFLNTTMFGMPLQEAIEAPRLASRSFPDSFWPHTYSPGKLEAERRIPKETRDALVGMGHEVAEWPDWEWRAGSVCAVKVGPEGTRWGGADPRRGALSIAR